MARPKGFTLGWQPKPEPAYWLERVLEVLREQEYPITNRQIFYRLVGVYEFEKTEKAYKRLCNWLTLARRARIIDFKRIRDDKVSSHVFGGFDGLEEFQQQIRESADDYHLDRRQAQPAEIELWCEAEGMLPQMARIAVAYDVACYSASGFLSVTATHDIAKRVAARDRDTLLLHVGDYDPSGESIFDTITLDAGEFVYALSDNELRTKRVALTQDQIDEHNIPTAPPKPSDSRSANWIGDTAQAEAMPAKLLDQYVEEAIVANMDMDMMMEIDAEEEDHRGRLAEWLDDLT